MVICDCDSSCLCTLLIYPVLSHDIWRRSASEEHLLKVYIAGSRERVPRNSKIYSFRIPVAEGWDTLVYWVSYRFRWWACFYLWSAFCSQPALPFIYISYFFTLHANIYSVHYWKIRCQFIVLLSKSAVCLNQLGSFGVSVIPLIHEWLQSSSHCRPITY